MSEKRQTEFERAAGQSASHGIVTDFWYLFRHSRKFWLVPIMMALVLLAGLMLLSGTAAAPFIYTLF